MADVHRFLVALPRGEQRVFLSWRLLQADALDVPFYVERLDGENWERVNKAPIVDSTTFVDTAPSAGTQTYRVVAGEGVACGSPCHLQRAHVLRCVMILRKIVFCIFISIMKHGIIHQRIWDVFMPIGGENW